MPFGTYCGMDVITPDDVITHDAISNPGESVTLMMDEMQTGSCSALERMLSPATPSVPLFTIGDSNSYTFNTIGEISDTEPISTDSVSNYIVLVPPFSWTFTSNGSGFSFSRGSFSSLDCISHNSGKTSYHDRRFHNGLVIFVNRHGSTSISSSVEDVLPGSLRLSLSSSTLRNVHHLDDAYFHRLYADASLPAIKKPSFFDELETPDTSERTVERIRDNYEDWKELSTTFLFVAATSVGVFFLTDYVLNMNLDKSNSVDFLYAKYSSILTTVATPVLALSAIWNLHKAKRELFAAEGKEYVSISERVSAGFSALKEKVLVPYYMLRDYCKSSASSVNSDGGSYENMPEAVYSRGNLVAPVILQYSSNLPSSSLSSSGGRMPPILPGYSLILSPSSVVQLNCE